MTLRDAMTTLFALGSLLVAADSCAAAPLAGARGGLRDRAAGYELTVLVDGVPVPTYFHDGETYVLGQLGARYTLRVANHSGRRIEAVVSVDGRDVIDGRPADVRGKRGYLVPAWGQVDIDGWRISHAQAAAFRFSSVPDSYAARTGSAREVGVVGVAIFPERYVPPVYRRPYALPSPQPYDGYRYRDRGYGPMPPNEAAPSAGDNSSAPAPASPTTGAAPRASAEGRGIGGYGTGAGAPRQFRSRPGLGTEYGEAVSSPIYEVEFVRANAVSPAVVLGLRYNDHDGLVALGIPVDGESMACDGDLDLRRTADPFPAADRRFAAPPPGWRRACDWR